MPRLALQHTSPVLQVFRPQGTLSGEMLMPHTNCEHFWPGSTHVPQLALQHTLPSLQKELPHGSSAAEAPAAGRGALAGTGGFTFAARALVPGAGTVFNASTSGATPIGGGVALATSDALDSLDALDALGMLLCTSD